MVRIMIYGNLHLAFRTLMGLDKETKVIRLFLLIGLLLMMNSAMAEPVLKVTMQSIDLQKVTELGEIEIEGVGTLKIVAPIKLKKLSIIEQN